MSFIKKIEPDAILKILGTIDKVQDSSVWSQPQVARAVEELELGARSVNEIKLSPDNVGDINYIISNLV